MAATPMDVGSGFTAELTDPAILELSKRFTCESELWDLGTHVLKLPENIIQAAHYDKKEIQDAAHKVLKTWVKQQPSREEAYSTLCTELKKYGMNELCILVKQWVEGESARSGLSTERKYCVNKQEVKDLWYI